MVFERKEINQEKPKTHFWTILKWYLFIIPSFYYILILPDLVSNDGGSIIRVDDLFTMIIQFSSYVMSGLMFATNPIEQSRSGVAGKFLIIAIVQQFIIRNIFGVILAFLAWHQLPRRINPELIDPEDAKKSHFKPRTILVLSISSLIIAILPVIANLT